MIDYEDLYKTCENHNIKIWYEESKKRYCMDGQAGVIATVLRSTRATHIEIESEIYELSEVTHQIYQKTEIKLAFNQLIII